ncbi:MAG: di-trans,poly-cis-decaprenylcistransferase [Acidimicrobiia bacterium]|nr:di-trans,poly-cis-decaprenylcistransferase [Acidimicrobiia bacterium]NNF11167.1 di-trans,poly-cis-decaprenylcistransferase [Acidimicrobiia bacterium]NNL69329.1 di-trans,poly-cis-decaprenylcistransferase [Acidimicrobiia bacterium]
MRAPRRLIPAPLLKPAYRLYEARLLQLIDQSKFPHHIAVILDGHRRYARSEGYRDYRDSYRAGMAKFEEFLEWTSTLGIEAVTGWLLSTENLKRPAAELDPLFEVFIEFFGRLSDCTNRLGYRVRFIGSLDLLPPELSAAAKHAEERSIQHPRRLTIALGYGGRQEIVDATRDLVRDLSGSAQPGEDITAGITPEAIARHLYASDIPDPDLVIRTSGESRLSGFLLWQAAYSEYSFVDVYWPEFRRVDFLRELRHYTRRERRFGQ